MAARSGRPRIRCNEMRRLSAIVVVAMIAAPLPRISVAQTPVGRVDPPATISGVVFDSIAHKPLGAARVELVNADSLSAPTKTIETDSVGRFHFDSVPAGRYLIGFTHPMLDSIGVERAPRAVTVGEVSRRVIVDLAIPSPRSLRLALCGAAAVADSQSLIIGVVRDAGSRSAVASAAVSVEWANVTIASGGLQRSSERRTYETQDSGWFALCGAPSSGTILLSASHDADSTEALELEMPASGFLRRDLYFGVSRAVAAETVAIVGDSLGATAGLSRAGSGRVTGVVVAAEGGRPLAGARVSIRNGPQTRADERGAFTLIGVPTGTRMLRARALAYAPLELPVDIVEGSAPLRIELVSLSSVLETVNVRGTLIGDRNVDAFLKRRRHGGAGRFMTEEEIATRNPILAVDLIRTMPGILLARDSNNYEILVQRSLTSFTREFCRVAVFVNGIALTDPRVDDLNAILRPAQMRGVEIYNGGSAPVEFSKRNGCGSVVIWTR